MSRCEGCGRDVSDDSVYCSFCGTRQWNNQPSLHGEERQASTGRFWRKCPSCGFNLVRGWEFCPGCGISRPRVGLKIVGVISLLTALLTFNAGAYQFGYYDPFGRVYAVAMAAGFAFVGLGLFLSRHPIVWWVSVTLWFLTGLEAFLSSYYFPGLYAAFVSVVIVSYLVVARRSFSILTG